MAVFVKRNMVGAVLTLALAAASSADAQTLVEQAMEHRFQLDFHVPDAALQKMLPQGWTPMISQGGPAKDANLRLIFIDRMDVMGPDGKPHGKGSTQMVYVAIPVKQVSGGGQGQMIVAGLTKDAADAPGAFGVYRKAVTAKMARSIETSGAEVLVNEDWEFSGDGGEHMQVHVKYERAPATKRSAETRFYNPADPAKYRIIKTEQGVDITRNATVKPPDRVKEFSYKAGGGRIAALFDGTEKVLSWDSFPWYSPMVFTP